jgi:hypothetical protein
MKKLLVFLAIAMIAGSAMAATGWFSDYLLVSNNGGADDYKWIDTDPSFGSAFVGSTFAITLGQTLELGADMSYWSDNQDRQGGAFYWSVDGGAANEVIWTQTGPVGNNFNGLAPSTVNVATGLGVGSHSLTVWAKSWGSSQGDNWLTAGGNNYAATIQVNQAIPEPATMSLLGLGALAMVLRRKIRK